MLNQDSRSLDFSVFDQVNWFTPTTTYLNSFSSFKGCSGINYSHGVLYRSSCSLCYRISCQKSQQALPSFQKPFLNSLGLGFRHPKRGTRGKNFHSLGYQLLMRGFWGLFFTCCTPPQTGEEEHKRICYWRWKFAFCVEKDDSSRKFLCDFVPSFLHPTSNLHSQTV